MAAKTTKAPPPWASTELETMRAMIADGKNYKEIGAALGRTRLAVSSMATRERRKKEKLGEGEGRRFIHQWTNRPSPTSAKITIDGVSVEIVCDDVDVLARALGAVLKM